MVSKTVDAEEEPRRPDLHPRQHGPPQSFTERAPKLGGLVEFYRSPDRVMWTPTGINVPDYPKLAQLWWQNIGDVNSGAFTPQQAMDRLADEMDDVMARMQAADEKAKTYGGCGPRLNPKKDPKEWLGKPDGPKAKLANEKPQGVTVDYDELVKRWTVKQLAAAGPSRVRRTRPVPLSPARDSRLRARRSAAAAIASTDEPRTQGRRAARRRRRRTSTRRASSSRPSGFNILLGHDARRQDHADAADGRPAPAHAPARSGSTASNVTGVPVRKRNVAMVYQQFINYPHLSVFENIASPLRVARRARPRRSSARVGRIAELLQLSPLLDRRPAELSGGQQQRTALARALVKDADLVLLDEPLANLDYKLREDLRDELPRLFADRDCTVVYATTEPAEALLLGGHTATLHEGRVTQFGPTADGLPPAGRPDDGARLLRSADQHRAGGEARRPHRARRRRRLAAPTARCAALADGAVHARAAAASRAAGRGAPARARDVACAVEGRRARSPRSAARKA